MSESHHENVVASGGLIGPCVWYTDLDRYKIDQSVWRLAPNELARAEMFVHELDRTRFITRRSWLRQVLSVATGVSPHDLVIGWSEAGKPFISNHSPFGFNTSSSGRWAACYCDRDEIGLDIESVEPDRPNQQILPEVLTESEHRDILSKPKPERYRRFVEVWTRKESLLKAIGCGLVDELNTIDVMCDAATIHVRTLSMACTWYLDTTVVNDAFVCSTACARPISVPVVKWDDALLSLP